MKAFRLRIKAYLNKGAPTWCDPFSVSRGFLSSANQTCAHVAHWTAHRRIGGSTPVAHVRFLRVCEVFSHHTPSQISTGFQSPAPRSDRGAGIPRKNRRTVPPYAGTGPSAERACDHTGPARVDPQIGSTATKLRRIEEPLGGYRYP